MVGGPDAAVRLNANAGQSCGHDRGKGHQQGVGRQRASTGGREQHRPTSAHRSLENHDKPVPAEGVACREDPPGGADHGGCRRNCEQRPPEAPVPVQESRDRPRGGRHSRQGDDPQHPHSRGETLLQRTGGSRRLGSRGLLLNGDEDPGPDGHRQRPNNRQQPERIGAQLPRRNDEVNVGEQASDRERRGNERDVEAVPTPQLAHGHQPSQGLLDLPYATAGAAERARCPPSDSPLIRGPCACSARRESALHRSPTARCRPGPILGPALRRGIRRALPIRRARGGMGRRGSGRRRARSRPARSLDRRGRRRRGCPRGDRRDQAPRPPAKTGKPACCCPLAHARALWLPQFARGKHRCLCRGRGRA